MTSANGTDRDLFFSAKPCLHKHVELLMNKQGDYLETLQTVCDTGVVATLSQPTKAVILAVLHVLGHHKWVQDFLQYCDVVSALKASQILDRPRKIKQLEQRIAGIEQAHPELVNEEGERQADKQDKKAKPEIYKRKKGIKGSKGQKQPANKDGANVEAQEQQKEQQKKKRKGRIDVYRAELKKAKVFLKGSHGSKGGVDCANAHENSAIKEIISSASLSGAFAKKIRRWVRTLKSDFLEFIVLSGSMDMWKDLADLVHFLPGDFCLPYFLAAAHGAALPEDSFVQGMRSLVDAPVVELATRFGELAKKHPQVYQAFNFLRMQNRLLQTKEIAVLLAMNCNLSTVIWYLEEIAQSEESVPGIVAHRLRTENWMDDDSSKVTGSFGKLLERILTFQSKGWLDAAECLKPAAARRLSALKEKWAPVATETADGMATEDIEAKGLTVVFGDKSASMTSAIQAATIIAAMVSACFQAELSFFDDVVVPSPHKRPGTVEHVMEIVQTIEAGNCTSMAAALWPYYAKKLKISRIILVSDEGENTSCHDFRFAQLLKAYMKEVNKDVELISICVDSGDLGFRENLASESIDYKRIEIDGYRPDLSKFDMLLGQIALLSRIASNESEQQAEVEDFVVLGGSISKATD